MTMAYCTDHKSLSLETFASTEDLSLEDTPALVEESLHVSLNAAFQMEKSLRVEEHVCNKCGTSFQQKFLLK